MRILVTGSSGHLGDGLVRQLRAAGHDVAGIDIVPAPSTDLVDSITDRAAVRRAMDGAEAVIHAATLHKPHISSHTRQDFLDVNLTGTLNLLEEAAAAGVGSFVHLSTTSAFGQALRPGPDQPAAWVTESVVPVPRNIYGVTKVAAEDLCQLIHQDAGLPVIVLRTSRFFPEDDDESDRRDAYDGLNLKVNELLYRRVDLADLVDACGLAIGRAPALGFGRYIISATTPFDPGDVVELRDDLPTVLTRLYPDYPEIYAALGWRMLPGIGRVYDNTAARQDLGWAPRWDFGAALNALAVGEDPRSELARAVGAKGYHADSHGIYTKR